ncbi:hypothetical protein MSAN_01587200 [Mycena sanguinolenta]|uniref:Uncharacterized protein n=1 Tax=Mycena sanguinolenta TaxID=230812 RepID=A0A8H6Y4C4_9AGAR|nr:hypothetical protein MSAN_01587200 [Mycena sanguinolenta]
MLGSSQTSSPASRNSMPPNLILALSILLAVILTIAAMLLFFWLKWRRRRRIHPGGERRSLAPIHPFTVASASSAREQDLRNGLRADPEKIMHLESFQSEHSLVEHSSTSGAATQDSLPVASQILRLVSTRSSAETESRSTERVSFPEVAKEYVEAVRPWTLRAEPRTSPSVEWPLSEGDELPPRYTSWR